MQDKGRGTGETDPVYDAIKLIQSIRGCCQVRLSDIFDIVLKCNKNISKNDFIKNGMPVIHVGEISRLYFHKIFDTVSKIDDRDFLTLPRASKNSILMCCEDFVKEKLGQSILYLGEETALVGSIAVLSVKNGFEDLASLEYLSYYFRNNKEFRNKIFKIATGTKVTRIKKEDLENIEIRLYSRQVQEETLSHLLQLDELISEDSVYPVMKQYEAYRKKFFDSMRK